MDWMEDLQEWIAMLDTCECCAPLFAGVVGELWQLL